MRKCPRQETQRSPHQEDGSNDDSGRLNHQLKVESLGVLQNLAKYLDREKDAYELVAFYHHVNIRALVRSHIERPQLLVQNHCQQVLVNCNL